MHTCALTLNLTDACAGQHKHSTKDSISTCSCYTTTTPGNLCSCSHPARMRALGRSPARRCSEQQVQPSAHGGSRYQAYGTQGVAGFNSEHDKQVLMHTPSAGSWQAGLMAGRICSYRTLLCPATCSTLLSLSWVSHRSLQQPTAAYTSANTALPGKDVTATQATFLAPIRL